MVHDASNICAVPFPLCFYPRQVLQADGSVLAVALNAIAAALADAGIPMRSMFGEVVCAGAFAANVRSGGGDTRSMTWWGVKQRVAHIFRVCVCVFKGSKQSPPAPEEN
jgi:hypothetical protein